MIVLLLAQMKLFTLQLSLSNSWRHYRSSCDTVQGRDWRAKIRLLLRYPQAMLKSQSMLSGSGISIEFRQR